MTLSKTPHFSPSSLTPLSGSFFEGDDFSVDLSTLQMSLGETWSSAPDFSPSFVCETAIGSEEPSRHCIPFLSAASLSHSVEKNGLGEGLISEFSGFSVNGRTLDFAFRTRIFHEKATGDYLFEFIPLHEIMNETAPQSVRLVSVYWPAPFSFEKPRSDWYTLLPYRQGLLIPNDWTIPMEKMAFDGLLNTADAYLPLFAQSQAGNAVLAVCETPANVGYEIRQTPSDPNLSKDANAPLTTQMRWRIEPSLGAVREKRIFRYRFLKNATHTTIAKAYRRMADEAGRLRTLAEKAVRHPALSQMAGAFFVHEGIKTHVRPDSRLYDPDHPEQNDYLETFQERTKEVDEWQKAGISKLYLHLDGWAEPGYDNEHPDYSPACEEAGGWEGMRTLVDRIHAAGYLFGIHDQYRDYYHSAPGFTETHAIHLEDGSLPGHHNWAGGEQTYLCARFAPRYVRRNFSLLEENGIRMDGAYLDVFTCNEGDECFDADHRMSRSDCYRLRNRCFYDLLAHNILPSSEEVNDWAVPAQVFCHYAPYDFMLRKPGTPKSGIPVPLYNLVYHDCVLQPWMMEKVAPDEDYMLHALLNGGAPYYIRRGAYPNIDGAFSDTVDLAQADHLSRCQTVASFHERVAFQELTEHRFVDADPNVQESLFADGSLVRVDFREGTYSISTGESES